MMSDTKTVELATNWRHLYCGDENLRRNLESIGTLSFAAIEALSNEQPRPRYLREDDAIVLICRAINMGSDTDPSDMVSVRIWCDGSQIITIANREQSIIADFQGTLANAAAPLKPSEILFHLIEFVTMQIRGTVRELETDTDELEDQSLQRTGAVYQENLKTLRHQMIWLKRFVEPQSVAFEDMIEDPPNWFSKQQITKLNGIYDGSLKAVETIRTIREHTMVLQDYLSNQAETSRKRVNYLLTLVAGVFLPINLLAGLLGANVGGIPGANRPDGFLILCGVAALVGITGVIIIQRLK